MQQYTRHGGDGREGDQAGEEGHVQRGRKLVGNPGNLTPFHDRRGPSQPSLAAYDQAPPSASRLSATPDEKTSTL